MSKPKFDPNQKFEVFQEPKPKFDPNADFESADEPKTDNLEAFHKNASDSALLGYAPQVRAGVIDPLVEKVGNLFTGNDVDMGDYLSNRDSYRKEIETSKLEHPGAATAGAISGALATSLMPGLNAAKGATATARALNAAKAGAVMGGAMNPGDTAGEFSGAQLGDRIENASTGMLVSGGLQGLGEGAIKGASYLKDKGGKALKDVAEKMAFKSGGAMLKDFRNASDRGTINETGRYILDQGLKIGDTVDDIAERAGSHNEALGSKLDDLYNQAGEMFKDKMNGKGFDPLRDKEEILQAAKKYLGDKVGADAAVAKLGGYLDEVAARHGGAPMSPRAANNIKSSLDDAINYSRNPLSKDPASELAYSAARNKINQKNLAAIESLDGGELADGLRATNKEYGLSKQVSKMANDMVNRQDGHKFFGLTDVIAGGAGATYGAVTGDWQSALLGMAAKKGLDKYGTTAIAVTADKISKQLLQSPKLKQLAAQNPNAYGAMVFNLVERLESKSGALSMPRAADKDGGNSALMNRYMSDPSVADSLKNENLKEQLKKKSEMSKITKPVPVNEAQASFIQGT